MIDTLLHIAVDTKYLSCQFVTANHMPFSRGILLSPSIFVHLWQNTAYGV